MSKPRLIASLVIALAVVVGTGWWGVKTFWLTAPRHDIAGVYTVGGDVAAPVPIYKPEPAYTEEAGAAKFEGTDVFSVVIDDRGTVEDVRLVKSVGKGLDESATQTLRIWRFKPAMKNGKPVPVRVIVEVSFKIF